MVPDPEYQIPLVVPFKIVLPIPHNTRITPTRKIMVFNGICRKLCRYLLGSINTSFVSGSIANPSTNNKRITKNRNNTRKGIALYRRCFLLRSRIFASSILFIMYKRPNTRARKNTENPNARFCMFRTASRPRYGVSHRDKLYSLTENCDPVKKVATTVPNKKVPNAPLINKKIS